MKWVARRIAPLVVALTCTFAAPSVAASAPVSSPNPPHVTVAPVPCAASDKVCQAKACKRHPSCRARVKAHARAKARHQRYIDRKVGHRRAVAARRHARYLARKRAAAERRRLSQVRHGCGQSPRQVPACLNYAIGVYRLGPAGRAWMYRVSRCESGWRWNAINLWDINARNGVPSKGLFQFIQPTFNGTPYGPQHSIYSNYYQALAAAWMYAHGQSRQWACR